MKIQFFLFLCCLQPLTLWCQSDYCQLSFTSKTYVHHKNEWTYGRADTITTMHNSDYNIKIINDSNFHEEYISNSSTIDYLLSPDKIYYQKNENSLWQINKTDSTYNYFAIQNNDSLVLKNVMPLTSPSFDSIHFKIFKDQTKIIQNLHCFKFELYTEKNNSKTTFKGYVTDQIDFSSDFYFYKKFNIPFCPVYLEKTQPNLPNKKTVIELVNYKPIDTNEFQIELNHLTKFRK